MALFIGRTQTEAIPVEEGLEWVSLDVSDPHPGQALCDRLHLKIDFNDKILRDKISGLFHKVVVDFSVLKFLTTDPWRHLAYLLQKTEGAQLICEGIAGGRVFFSEEEYKESKSGPPTGWYSLNYSAQPLSKDEEAQRSQEAERDELQRTGKYLNHFFKQVNQVQGVFPYSSPNSQPTDYFIATSRQEPIDYLIAARRRQK